MRDYLKNKLGVPENWDKYDYQTQRYSFEDIEEILQTYKDEQLRIGGVSNSCGFGDTSILIKGLKDISNWNEEQKEWYDDPEHCANMTLIKYYNSKK